MLPDPCTSRPQMVESPVLSQPSVPNIGVPTIQRFLSAKWRVWAKAGTLYPKIVPCRVKLIATFNLSFFPFFKARLAFAVGLT